MIATGMPVRAHWFASNFATPVMCGRPNRRAKQHGPVCPTHSAKAISIGPFGPLVNTVSAHTGSKATNQMATNNNSTVQTGEPPTIARANSDEQR